MKQEKIDFAEFGKPFQEKLAFCILEDAQFANQIGEVLDYNFFELRYIIPLLRPKIFNFFFHAVSLPQ